MKFIIFFILAVAIVSARKGFGPGEQEWGYSEVRPGANMFWWLYYTTQPGKPTDKPLVLWLQGGPGASSTGFGNFEELGPLDSNLKPRNFSWVKDCNVMFVDNPVGTGWSYVNSTSLLTTTNKQIALDLLQMMKDFYSEFPEFEKTALYITCESYGGKMVAEFALHLDAAIKRGEIKANFKGVGLGDSWISPIDSVMTWAPFLLEFGMVDQRGYDAIMKRANLCKKAVENGEWDLATDEWSRTEGVILKEAHGVDFYNVLTKIYYKRKSRRIPLPGIFSKRNNSYSLNSVMNVQVREALGLPDHVYWLESSNAVFMELWTDFMKPVTKIVEQLLDTTDIKVAVFTGQLDLIVDTPGTVNWVENLQWKGKDGWVKSARYPLVSNDYVEGFVKKYEKFGLYWVNRAGHMVPADNPAGMDAVLRDLTDDYSGRCKWMRICWYQEEERINGLQTIHKMLLLSATTKYQVIFEVKCTSGRPHHAGKKYIYVQTGGDGKGAITEGLRSALARLRQRSAPPGSPTTPLHQPGSPQHSLSGPDSRVSSPEHHGHPKPATPVHHRTSVSSTSSTPSANTSTSGGKMTVNSQSGPTDDLISTATSALRRLHFKTGRMSTKAKASSGSTAQVVPKVIVMGSSTASETTINTSTDSSNTIITTMTATDGDVTEDSLDLTEPVDILNSENVFADVLSSPVQPFQPPTPRSPMCPTSEHKFTFDLPLDHQGTPKTAIQNNKFVFDSPSIPEYEPPDKRNGDVEKMMQRQVDALNADVQKHRSSIKSKAESRKFTFASESSQSSDDPDKGSPKIKRSQSPKHHHRTKPGSDDLASPSPKSKSGGRQRSARSSNSSGKHSRSPKFPQADKFTYDEKHIAKYRERARMTPPLPDLRVDFFSERVSDAATDGLMLPASSEKRGSVCLNKCLREVGACLDSTSPINVTTNPMDGSVGTQQHLHHQPHYRKATIVVQQPSLSLDHTNVSTILLRNGAEFVSNVESGAKVCLLKQREDNMKQLLEVANTLTQEEIHDFEMRYGSPHHSRSQSVKTPGRSSGRPNYLCLPQQRSRVASMPNTGVEEEYYRLRHFSITGKGVVNRGDSLKSRRSRSNNSVASSNSSTEHIPAGVGSARTSASCSLASSRESSTSNPGPAPYRVLMLGGPAVGKSSLVSQFMTSEYLHAYDTSLDDESGEKSVSVLLAGEESELTFIDHPYNELSPERCITKYSDLQAYCVVYASSDRSSLSIAERILQSLWTSDTVSTKAVILVSNKADLVRSRVVSTEEGKSMATSYDCKYIETSVGINHNVDELLVGLLTQIRLKLENPERTRDIFRKRSNSRKNLHRNKSPASGQETPTGSAQNSPKKYRGSRTSASLKVRGLLGKVWARDSKSKSCENLHVL